MKGVANIYAIVPAAGRSRRFGGMKQVAPAADGKPMLRGVIDAVRDGGVRHVLIVANEALRPHLPRLLADARVVFNDEPEAEMIDSIRLGLRAWEETNGPATRDGAGGFLVCPCDAAGLSADDVHRCVDAFGEDPTRLVIASRNGKRGHPILFPAALASVVLSGQCDAGLNQLAKSRPQDVKLVDCKSPGVTANVNTPQDMTGARTDAGKQE
jgi:molybdenum cofactor cytidylyltransferase